VYSSGWFILGPEVDAFEKEFANYIGVKHAISVGNGTDALVIGLKAIGVGQGDEVITVPNTAVATVAAIELTGATPVFVDVRPDTMLMDADRVAHAITQNTKAIVPVHLFGQSVDLDPIFDLARQHDFLVFEDCAQSHAATYKGKKTGSMGAAASFSFYPTKNLGALGDGGMVVTNDDAVADHARLLRQYGWRERYISEIKGMNTRLDELQAALLRVKLKHLDAWTQARRERAALYDELLSSNITTPTQASYGESVYHLYVIQSQRRDALMAHLKAKGIGTSIQYPVPIHLQQAYRDVAPAGSLPVAEKLATEILSLPMYPELTLDEVREVAEAVSAFA
jgi:dTDP-4-amino-4,6-dideoxygalactose transaminase